MIQVYKTDNKDYDSNGDMTLFPTIAYTDSKLNKEWIASLIHPIDSDGRWKYLEENAVVKMPSFNGDQLYRIRKIYKADSGIVCAMEPVFYDSIDNCFLVDVRPTDKTGQEALDLMLAPMNLIYTAESDITATNTAYYIYKNFMEALNGDIDQSFINRWGGEILFDNFKIIVNKKIGSDNGVELRYGKNVSYDGLTEEIDTRDIVTRIYPKAYNGYTMTDNGYVDSENINAYPTIRARALTFDDVKMAEDVMEDDEANGVVVCTTQEELDAALTQKCQDYFATGADKPKVTITADMVVLKRSELYGGYSFLEKISLGDTVYCRHDKLDIATDSRVIELKYDSIRKKVSKVVIGDFKKDWFELFGYFASGNKTTSGTGNSSAGSGSGSGSGTTTTTTYTWGKYEAITETSGEYTLSYETGESKSYYASGISSAAKVIYKTMTFDSVKGTIALSEPLSEEQSAWTTQYENYQAYPYYYGDYLDGSTNNTVYKITTMTKTTGTLITYKHTSDKLIPVQNGEVTYSKGTYIEDVTSKDSEAYPKNGYQDGYWYVKK